MLPDRLTPQPIARFQGTLTLPGSKSLSNRVLLLSALADGETEVTRALDSEDTEVMLAALRDLGVGVRGEPGPRSSLWIAGKGGPLDAPAGRVSLFLGNAGTAMRPLPAGLGGGPRIVHALRRAAHARAADRRSARRARAARRAHPLPRAQRLSAALHRGERNPWRHRAPQRSHEQPVPLGALDGGAARRGARRP